MSVFWVSAPFRLVGGYRRFSSSVAGLGLRTVVRSWRQIHWCRAANHLCSERVRDRRELVQNRNRPRNSHVGGTDGYFHVSEQQTAAAPFIRVSISCFFFLCVLHCCNLKLVVDNIWTRKFSGFRITSPAFVLGAASPPPPQNTPYLKLNLWDAQGVRQFVSPGRKFCYNITKRAMVNRQGFAKVGINDSAFVHFLSFL